MRMYGIREKFPICRFQARLQNIRFGTRCRRNREDDSFSRLQIAAGLETVCLIYDMYIFCIHLKAPFIHDISLLHLYEAFKAIMHCSGGFPHLSNDFINGNGPDRCIAAVLACIAIVTHYINAAVRNDDRRI